MITTSLGLTLAALPVAFAATFTVQVGAGGNLTYDPEFVLANPGDTINFVFNPKNHTVTQSSFDTPCVALPGGVDSGFVPVPAGTNPPPPSQLVVQDTSPHWFYCRQTGHCGQGMVFAINPPADPNPRSFSAFKALAIAQNGTASASASSSTTSSASSTATSAFVTPPPPQWQSATATVTFDGSVYTTTYTSYDGTPRTSPYPAANPVDHKIVVGPNGQLSYSPANITASIGDTVTFEFHPKNHTVTQSSFLHPCEALEVTSGTPGFKSGFRPVDANATDFPTFQIKINDTAPIWGYCGQTGHCAAGMVFAINAVESGPNNFENFLALAKEEGNQTSTSTGSSSATSSAPGSKNTNAAVLSRVGSSVFLGLTFFGLMAVML
ncbi:Cupredoxin [Gymnopilus junonius]|uniref:Cupredoxin n=1 Tax=Gymnopilus junonius TaxID=109634 RepID=A0A9P5NQ50_GYMJU|nr:Cupredoxin [Gymnopilus junonius]